MQAKPDSFQKKQDLRSPWDPPTDTAAPPTAITETSPQLLAQAYLALIPIMMGSLRSRLRTLEVGDLRMGPFRVLMEVHVEKNPTLSQVAINMGLALPAASKIADELESRGYIARTPDQADRRKNMLSLTAAGERVMNVVKNEAEKHFANLFASLTAAERGFLLCAAETLRPVFRVSGASSPPADSPKAAVSGGKKSYKSGRE